MRQVIKRQDRCVAPVWPGPGPTRDGAPRLDWSSDGWWLSAHTGPVSISLCHGLVTGTDPHVSVTPPCHVTTHPNITWSLHQTMAITISQKARWSNTDNGGFIIVCPNIVWSWLGKFEWGKSPHFVLESSQGMKVMGMMTPRLDQLWHGAGAGLMSTDR